MLAAERLTAMPNHLVCKVGRYDHHPAARRHGQRFRLPDTPGRNGPGQRHRQPPIYERNRRVIRVSTALIIEGVLQKDQGCIDLLAKRFWLLETHETLDGIHARNFRLTISRSKMTNQS
ncbi:MAG: hypothetical protein GIX02_09005 [Candidatus Eremiobacteraeota bacterium]|nr:hypothetical protein [Candidatus Eremiobacteraeota bacterium]